jgi:hypothetical protein
VTFSNSTLEALGTPVGTQYRVTLGTMSDSTATRARAGTIAMTWAKSASAWDYAGNSVVTGSFTEPAPADADF